MTRKWILRTLLALLLLALAPTALAAQAGDLDPSFDGDGKAVLPVKIFPGDVLTQPDGKAIVTDEESFKVMRVNPDGSLDDNFGGDGVASVEFGEGATIGSAVLQPDGKILVAGQTGQASGYALAIARLTESGSLDPTFGPGGPDGDGKRVYTGGAGPWSADALVLEPNGRIIVAGGTGSGITAARLDTSGAPDGTYYEYAHDFTDSESVHAAALGPDGSLVVAGQSQTSQTTDLDAVVVRFKDDGKLDTTLGGKGYVKLGPDDRNDTARQVLVQQDGKIVLVGNSGPAERQTTLTRLNSKGELDESFGEGGRVAPDFAGDDEFAGAALQADGKVLVAATTDPGLEFAIARVDAGGKLDAGFGTGGKRIVAFDDIAMAYAAGLQADGRFVVAGVTAVEGRTALRTALARVLGDQPPEVGGGGGGGGNPVAAAKCGGRVATIVGTAKRDTLRGTRGADVIAALGGNDRVQGLRGNDIVCGGAGADRLEGGAGRDRLLGGPGRDRLLGGPGHDRLIGGGSSDVCVGAGGHDAATRCEARRSL